MSVYRKALKLSASERHVRSLGEITNLTSIDAQRLQGTVHDAVFFLFSRSFLLLDYPTLSSLTCDPNNIVLFFP